MFSNFFYVILLQIVLNSVYAESEIKTIKYDLSEEMVNVAVGISEAMFNAQVSHALIAKQLAKEFNKLYGNQWYCLLDLMV